MIELDIFVKKQFQLWILSYSIFLAFAPSHLALVCKKIKKRAFSAEKPEMDLVKKGFRYFSLPSVVTQLGLFHVLYFNFLAAKKLSFVDPDSDLFYR